MSAAWATAQPAIIRGEEAFQRARRARRQATLLALVVAVACVVLSAWVSEAYPARIAAGLPRIGEYFTKILPDLRWVHLFAGSGTEGSIAFWLYRLDAWALLLVQTANMAAIGTLLGAIMGVPMAFLAASNTAPSRLIFHASRRFLEALRTVPDIVYALIFVWAFGIGPLAGVLAIAIHSAGALGKQCAESIENIDNGPREGMVAAGANWFEACRFGALPLGLNQILSYLLLRFEVNLRSASVIGFVGAGGIGEELYKVISFNYYEEISAIILLVILAVMCIDLLSERLRRRVEGMA